MPNVNKSYLGGYLILLIMLMGLMLLIEVDYRYIQDLQRRVGTLEAQVKQCLKK